MALRVAFLLPLIASTALFGGASRADGSAAAVLPPAPATAPQRDGDCVRLMLLDNRCVPLEDLLGQRIFEPLAAGGGDTKTRSPRDRPRTAAVSYQLNDALTAGLSYRHLYLFGLSQGDALRGTPFTDFSTERERDVLNLQLSWRLRWTFLDLGYRLDSPRAAPGAVHGLSVNRFWPEDGNRTHSLMLGVRREWGGD